ncbi:Uncharacterised protein [Enterobacter cancerogenus]|uniref:Uncharacterized protein n=1 Tax=Enterobacter cancerogenus TaxID=69218 RepID=A0A484ZCE1_9ENTR|nr:Uncharacterised protein [Enterobacter cancerogenus]
MSSRRIAQQRYRIFAVARQQGRQQIIILAKAAAGVPRRTVFRAILKAGKGFLQFRKRLQTRSQRLIVCGGLMNLLLCGRYQTAVGGEGDHHRNAPSHHQYNDRTQEYFWGADAGLTRAQARRERLHRISNNVPAVILTPVVFHAARGSR